MDQAHLRFHAGHLEDSWPRHVRMNDSEQQGRYFKAVFRLEDVAIDLARLNKKYVMLKFCK